MPKSPSGIPAATRALPDRPSLEFERKRAKTLLRRIRRENPNAQLADAQFSVARELGFASWPRLVQYFEELERETHAPRRLGSDDASTYEGRARSLLVEHAHRRDWAGRALASYVPRFFGLSVDEVLSRTVTEEDARLAVARQHQRTSWTHLLEDAAAERARRGDPWAEQTSPFMRALHAMRRGDLRALASIIDEHPELLDGSTANELRRPSLAVDALVLEMRDPTPQARATVDWLLARGLDVTRAANELLLGSHGITVAQVQMLLDHGADPHWLPPNGVSVLEHALLRYANGDSVDVIARQVRPPRGVLWIAAGLGDVAALRRCFTSDGTLIPSAYASRPPFHVMGSQSFPLLPSPTPLDILTEAAFVAALNGRTAAIEVLIEHGFPIDYIGWGGTSLLRFAIGQKNVSMVETLLRLGADLDKKGEFPHASPREFARMIVHHDPNNQDLRRILELCDAGTPEGVLAEMDRQRPSQPPLSKWLEEALASASDDAAGRNEVVVRPENLFVGLLGRPGLTLAFLADAGVNVTSLRVALAERLDREQERQARPNLPLNAEAQRILDRAIARADERRHDTVGPMRLLEALIEDDAGFVPDLVIACGGDLSHLRRALAKA